MGTTWRPDLCRLMQDRAGRGYSMPAGTPRRPTVPRGTFVTVYHGTDLRHAEMIHKCGIQSRWLGYGPFVALSLGHALRFAAWHAVESAVDGLLISARIKSDNLVADDLTDGFYVPGGIAPSYITAAVPIDLREFANVRIDPRKNEQNGRTHWATGDRTESFISRLCTSRSVARYRPSVGSHTRTGERSHESA